MKTSFLLSVAFGVVTFVAVFMVWSVLGAAGVWDSINSTVASVVEGDTNASDFDVTDYVGMGRVLGFTLLVSIIDVILLTAHRDPHGLPLQHGRGPPRRHRGHPRRGRALTGSHAPRGRRTAFCDGPRRWGNVPLGSPVAAVSSYSGDPGL